MRDTSSVAAPARHSILRVWTILKSQITSTQLEREPPSTLPNGSAAQLRKADTLPRWAKSAASKLRPIFLAAAGHRRMRVVQRPVESVMVELFRLFWSNLVLAPGFHGKEVPAEGKGDNRTRRQRQPAALMTSPRPLGVA
jgi:hypothetical protein